MLKRLAIVGLLMIGLCDGAWSQVPGNGSGQRNKAQGKQETADLSKPVVAIESPASANKQDHASEKPAKYPWGELLAPVNIPNWFLVAVGGVTGWFVYKTLRAIKKQADLMDKQIALQSVAMRQWVNIEPVGTVTPRTFEGRFEVTLQFVVRNKTDYLLTIKKIVAEVFTSGKETIFTVSCDEPIPPEKSGAIGGHPFYMSANVSRYTWDTDGHPFLIGGDVTFLDCMKIEQTQNFHGFFHGYADGRLLEKKPSGIVPEVADYKPEEEKPQNPT
jgi:hypothetical protein